MTLPPDPRTAPDDEDAATTDATPDVTNRGESARQPAEGADDEPGELPGSPRG